MISLGELELFYMARFTLAWIVAGSHTLWYSTTGSTCEINIDDCEGAPCRNGAECVDGINKYTCLCKAGYEGGRCQEQ